MKACTLQSNDHLVGGVQEGRGDGPGIIDRGKVSPLRWQIKLHVHAVELMGLASRPNHSGRISKPTAKSAGGGKRQQENSHAKHRNDAEGDPQGARKFQGDHFLRNFKWRVRRWFDFYHPSTVPSHAEGGLRLCFKISEIKTSFGRSQEGS